MDHEQFFIFIKQRVINDLGDNFSAACLDQVSVDLLSHPRSQHGHDQYRSRTAKVPAYYNPNTRCVHINTQILASARPEVVENVYYHELVHAASHHARLQYNDYDVLKSGLKIQLWEDGNRPTILHRHLNEGFTQYLTNSYTPAGPAYRNEVRIIGRLVRRIGLNDLKAAYFGPAIDRLEKKVSATFGTNTLQKLSDLCDQRLYEEAETLIN